MVPNRGRRDNFEPKIGKGQFWAKIWEKDNFGPKIGEKGNFGPKLAKKGNFGPKIGKGPMLGKKWGKRANFGLIFGLFSLLMISNQFIFPGQYGEMTNFVFGKGLKILTKDIIINFSALTVITLLYFWLIKRNFTISLTRHVIRVLFGGGGWGGGGVDANFVKKLTFFKFICCARKHYF